MCAPPRGANDPWLYKMRNCARATLFTSAVNPIFASINIYIEQFWNWFDSFNVQPIQNCKCKSYTQVQTLVIVKINWSKFTKFIYYKQCSIFIFVNKQQTNWNWNKLQLLAMKECNVLIVRMIVLYDCYSKDYDDLHNHGLIDCC